MTFNFPERRRALRANITAPSWLTLPAAWEIQLLDIGLGGVAFTSPHHLEIGRTASLLATLGSHALNTEVRICWSRSRSTAPGQSEFEIGAAFLPLPESSRRALEGFLKLSPAE